MAFSMTDSQKSTLSVKFEDKKGNPAPVDPGTTPTWSTDNTDVLQLTPSADGLSCDVAAVGPLGVGTVTLKASAGGSDIIGTVQITITGGAATQVEIDNTPPVEQ